MTDPLRMLREAEVPPLKHAGTPLVCFFEDRTPQETKRVAFYSNSLRVPSSQLKSPA